MKHLWLNTTSLAGLGIAALCAGAPARAEEPIKLSVGGFFRSAYMIVVDDNDRDEHFHNIEPGYDHNTDGFFSDAEIHFKGRTVLDNGLEVGARVELEGESEDEEGGDQIDEAWIYFAGNFGEIRIGSEDEALAQACIMPPGGTANFSAFSPNQWGANAFTPFSNSACTGVDDRSDAQKILYISPVFAGFQLTLSYTPNPEDETHNDGVGPHLGMPAKFIGDPDYNASVYLTYSHEGRGWGLTWGGGVSMQRGIDDIEDAFFDDRFGERTFYQTALTFDVGRVSIGGVFEYYDNIFFNQSSFAGFEFANDNDAWVAGGGIAYIHNAWTFGAQYSYRQDTFTEGSSISGFDKVERQQQRAVLTVDYVLGPGINLDAELGYTWRDFDPEIEDPFNVGVQDDDYGGFEIGFGSSLRF